MHVAFTIKTVRKADYKEPLNQSAKCQPVIFVWKTHYRGWLVYSMKQLNVLFVNKKYFFELPLICHESIRLNFKINLAPNRRQICFRLSCNKKM